MIRRPGQHRAALSAGQPLGCLPILIWLVIAGAGCGGSRATPARNAADDDDTFGRADVHGPPPDAGAPAARSLAAPRPLQLLRRHAVRAAVAQGLGILLQRVELDDRPVRVGGKFHGFRILALHDGAFWAGVDLKPGDVVTTVNGLPIERPEQAQMAFESLEAASELRVAYEREGEARELVVPIVDER
ncbi:MAG: hypothetical protein M3O50_03235 [Myxococcota bacterium]|nr:hypothetical protein [Myxococcota bacterium]